MGLCGYLKVLLICLQFLIKSSFEGPSTNQPPRPRLLLPFLMPFLLLPFLLLPFLPLPSLPSSLQLLQLNVAGRLST